ncbi:dihydropteroate synthase [Raineyella fluvialis]|uniref:Dihydropteroate synthase n=2 Tax=Raineyella fluvialis TaxID=2662261 RepID=A0A5Q2FDG6_9ACTN|nr:dihydropteroate synthase [Raineyella fluvialis]
MGIVNVTPDSFSDGGDHSDTASAVRHGLALLAEGADMLDVGGESTRPGIERTPEAEELRRVVPVVEELAARGAIVSVDTMRASVARATAAAGATIINDVSGGLADPQMYAAVAESGCAYVVMHWRGHSTEMDRHTGYTDVVGQVRDEIAERVELALAAGIAADDIIVDPGIGFAKTREQDWELLRQVGVLSGLGYPVLIGVSRKRFLGEVLAETRLAHTPKDRDFATAAVTGWMAERGIWAVRTHEVRAQRDAIAVVQALRGEGPRDEVTDRVVGTFLEGDH